MDSITFEAHAGYGDTSVIWDNEWVMANLKPSTTYFISFFISTLERPSSISNWNQGLALYKDGMGYASQFTYSDEHYKDRYYTTFTTPADLTGYYIAGYSMVYNGTPVEFGRVTLDYLMLVEGSYSSSDIPFYIPIKLGCGTSRADSYDDMTDEILATYTEVPTEGGSEGTYHLEVLYDTDLYIDFELDSFDVTVNVNFVAGNGVKLYESDYVNIVIYNKDKNVAYYAHIVGGTASGLDENTVTQLFGGLLGGEYIIGIYESSFGDIVGESDMNYQVGGGSTVAFDKTSNANYTIKLDATKTGIVINVVVTKEYDNWLYATN